MKSFIFSITMLVAVAAFGVAPAAHAAMPNFVGTGYYPAQACGNDHPVWENVNGSPEVTGCIERAAYEQSKADARTLQDTGFHFGIGEFVRLLTGERVECPSWYGKHMGCVISQSLILQ